MARSVAEFARTGTSDQTFLDLVRAVATHLDVPRVLAFRATKNRRELAIVGGCGDDIEGLTKELRLPLTPARTAVEPISMAYHLQRDYFFEDVFNGRIVSTLPQRYFEAIGSTSLLILACCNRGVLPVLLLADVEPPRKLPSPERVSNIKSARAAIATLAPRVVQ